MALSEARNCKKWVIAENSTREFIRNTPLICATMATRRRLRLLTAAKMSPHHPSGPWQSKDRMWYKWGYLDDIKTFVMMAGGYPRCWIENHARYAAVWILDISCTICASERIDRCTSDCKVIAREKECYWSVSGVVCLPFVGYYWPIFSRRWQGTYGQDMKVPHQKSHYNNTIKIDRRFIHVLSMILAAESIPCSQCLDH